MAEEIMSQEEFCRRFKARMLSVAGDQFQGGGGSIAEYADETAPSYWEQDWQRQDGPEFCADTDISYWEE